MDESSLLSSMDVYKQQVVLKHVYFHITMIHLLSSCIFFASFLHSIFQIQQVDTALLACDDGDPRLDELRVLQSDLAEALRLTEGGLVG